MKLRTYGKGELAQLYCPNITTAAARKKLMQWIHHTHTSWKTFISPASLMLPVASPRHKSD